MANDFEKAKECAFWYINKRRYTKKELINKLVQREYDRDVAEEAVEYLEELDYINEADYARRYIHDAIRIKKHGIVRIKNDLFQKGIDRNIIDEVLVDTDVDCTKVIDELIQIRAKNLDLSDEKQFNKLVAFLVRRGFRYGEAVQSVRNYRENKGEL